MSTINNRLTLYAILSAIEEDLRRLINDFILVEYPFERVFPESVVKKSMERAKSNTDNLFFDEEQMPIHFTDLPDLIQLLNNKSPLIGEDFSKKYKKYSTQLNKIVPIRNRVMHSRPLEFGDYGSITEISKHLLKVNPDIWKKLSQAIREIKNNPSFLSGLQILIQKEEERILHNLPLPEFDDTGFIGRSESLDRVKKAIMGSYPVINITGGGGVGKTALALKACYDLVDDEDFPFEALIWTTAKATKLTSSEVASINGSIKSSIGIFDSAYSVISGETNNEPKNALELLIHSLETFPMLLVIDNLETVFDDNIIKLIESVPRSSKILFTSRVGINGFQFPIPLDPFQPKDAVYYLRSLAKLWSQSSIASASKESINNYCKKLQYNPLIMKWFVQSVANGKSPTRLIENQKVAIEFCLSNIYDSLNESDKKILQSLVLLGEPRSTSALAYFSDIDISTVENSVGSLLASNLVIPTHDHDSNEDQRFTPAGMLDLYIRKYTTIEEKFQSGIIKKKKNLVAHKESIMAMQNQNPYDLNNIDIRTDDDLVVAKILKDSIKYIKKFTKSDDQEDIERAKKYAEQALNRSSTYFECHRILASVHWHRKDAIKAKEYFESAISLNPNHSPLYLWYGDFLAKQLNDPDAAIEEYSKGLEIDNSSPQLFAAKARASMYLRKFDDANDFLDEAFKIKNIPLRLQKRLVDLRFQYYQRKIEFEIECDELDHALATFSAFKICYDEENYNLIDDITRGKITKIRFSLAKISRFFDGTPQENIAKNLHNWFVQEFLAVNI